MLTSYFSIQVIASLVTPTISGKEIKDFLTGHIQHNLFLLGEIFDRYKNNDGDKRLIVHVLLKCLMEIKDSTGMKFMKFLLPFFLFNLYF